MDMKINNPENQDYQIPTQEENNNEENIEEIINQDSPYENKEYISIPKEEKLSEYIQVFCRFRPPNESELSFSTNNSVILLSQKQLIITQEKKLELKKDYTFDALFEYDTPKEIFYQKTSKNIVNAVLQGYNGGIICYGETGTGKSYTLKEIIPQVEKQIFDFIDESDEDNELFKIDLAMIEIYKEQVNDLIDLKNTNLNLIENKSKKLIIDNLTHIGVSSKEQLEQIINKGLNNRNSREFNYNSKSHFITMITVYHYYKRENYIKIGKLYLVDLEGSERISKFNIEGENLEEQKLINKSLIALSIIVQNLSNENDNITYAPYRDSKLTRIISDCFGGNAYTTLILNCSKHECSTVQTRNTLMFGEKVKKIKNKPIINIENISGNGLSYFDNDEILNNFENGNREMGIGHDKKNLKYIETIKQMKEKINYLNLHIEQLNIRNAKLENEKKNIIDKVTEGGKNKINKFYLQNNLDDLHELLNEKENKEAELINEINSLKIIIEKNNKEFNEMKQSHDENMKTCKDLTECLDEAGNQIKNKDMTIDELKNKDEINIKEITNLKQELNELNNEKENIIKTNNEKTTELNENINALNKKIEELNKELNSKEKNISNLTKEKESFLKSKENYENRINQQREQINKLKEEINPNKIRSQKLEMDNLTRKFEDSNKKIEKLKEENNKLKEKLNILEKEKKEMKNNNLLNENNTLKNQIKLLEKNYNTLSTKNKELTTQINNQRNTTRTYSESKGEKDSKEIYNLKQENKRLNERLISLEKHKKEENKLRVEIKNKDKTHEEFEAEFHQIIQDNDSKITEIKNLQKKLDNINKENIRNKNTIDNLRKEISEKNKIIEQNKKNNLYNNNTNNNTNNYSPIYSNRTNSSNKYISDIRQKNEMITKENNENKKVIENLKREIQTKTKLLEENNKYKQCTCDKSLIERLRQEIKSKEYIINDYKIKLDNLKRDITSKEKIINDYKKTKYSSNYTQRNNNVLILDTQNRSNNSYGKYTNNNSTNNIKENNSNYKFVYNYKRINQANENESQIETLNKEINKYKEIIRQKDIEIINIKKECHGLNKYDCIERNPNYNNQNVAELQKIIKELRFENKKLKEQIIDYDNLKAEIEFIYKRGGNYSFKETNKTSLKLAYDALVEENRQLRNKITRIEKNMK